jgi:hypothetical protein
LLLKWRFAKEAANRKPDKLAHPSIQRHLREAKCMIRDFICSLILIDLPLAISLIAGRLARFIDGNIYNTEKRADSC